MTANACVLDAPWLHGRRGCIDTALGAAVWLWMHDEHRRRVSIQDIQQRWLAPIAVGQYVIARGTTACLGDDAGVRPQALLLFARFDEQAEARYLACPQGRIATREWCSGDRCVFRASWTSSSTSLTPCSAPQSVGFFHLPRELPAGLGLLTTHWLG